jgi:hypothetical protein
MLPIVLGQLLPFFKDALQSVAYLAVMLLALVAAWQLRGIGTAGNRIQLDIDLQVMELAAGSDLIGELSVALQNMGSRHQKLSNLFIEVRPSRHVSPNGLPLVPPVNMIGPALYSIVLAPGVRQLVTWTFEIPRDQKLLRATALINTGARLESEVVPTLSQQYFAEFGSSMRYTSRIFEVSPGLFRRL